MSEFFMGAVVKRYELDDFYGLVNTMYNNGDITLTESQVEGNEIIYSIGGNLVFCDIPIPVICVNNDAFDSVCEDTQIAIMAHEVAHINGISNEEEADRWALDNINKKQQDILKSMWYDRHGCEYGDITQR